MFVDSHCHLNSPEFHDPEHPERWPEVLATMAANGVEHALCVSVNLEDWPDMMTLVGRHAGLLSASVGVHPDYLDVAEPTVAQLVQLVRQVQEVVPGARPPAVSEYLRWLQNPEAGPMGASAGAQPPDDDTLWQHAAPLVDDCLADFQASRAREGAQLATLLREQAARMAELAGRLRPHLPTLHAAAENRLFERLNRAVDRLSLNIPPEETLARVRQEISLLSLKDDITEELDRLDTHLEAMDKALAAGGPVGKRLDFLSQELNREANTIASKSIALSITDTALALKLHIEQVREQVQNLE